MTSPEELTDQIVIVIGNVFSDSPVNRGAPLTSP
jgi:hypothetical protein